MQHIEYVEKLSLHEQFRLVEIAHETTDHAIRQNALTVLRQYLNPLVFVSSIKECPKCDFGTKPPVCMVPGCPIDGKH